ncbi:hypothetical protein [Lentibacillus jeotgali]|uniref:hypothetical protein n=1 Tax=Lentibacillus jeotgali TaxID=558169 RepID=UPI000262701E|nr:hypothetical protein [Lentibacillus jeotgali]
MDLYVNGAYQSVDIGYVKEGKEFSVVFIVKDGEVEISIDPVTLDAIQTIIQADEDALIPLDLDTKTVILDGEPTKYIPLTGARDKFRYKRFEA